MPLRKIKLTLTNFAIGKAKTKTYPVDNGIRYEIPQYLLWVQGTTAEGFPLMVPFFVLRFGLFKKTAASAPVMVGLANPQTYTIYRWLPTYSVHSASSYEIGAWQVKGDYLIHDGPDDTKNEVYATIGCVEICGGPRGFDKFNDLLIALSGTTKPTRNEQLLQIGANGIIEITYQGATMPPIKPWEY